MRWHSLFGCYGLDTQANHIVPDFCPRCQHSGHGEHARSSRPVWLRSSSKHRPTSWDARQGTSGRPTTVLPLYRPRCIIILLMVSDSFLLFALVLVPWKEATPKPSIVKLHMARAPLNGTIQGSCFMKSFPHALRDSHSCLGDSRWMCPAQSSIYWFSSNPTF